MTKEKTASAPEDKTPLLPFILFLLKALAVGTRNNLGVAFVGAYFDALKRAEIFCDIVMLAACDVALDAMVDIGIVAHFFTSKLYIYIFAPQAKNMLTLFFRKNNM